MTAVPIKVAVDCPRLPHRPDDGLLSLDAPTVAHQPMGVPPLPLSLAVSLAVSVSASVSITVSVSVSITISVSGLFPITLPLPLPIALVVLIVHRVGRFLLCEPPLTLGGGRRGLAKVSHALGTRVGDRGSFCNVGCGCGSRGSWGWVKQGQVGLVEIREPLVSLEVLLRFELG